MNRMRDMCERPGGGFPLDLYTCPYVHTEMPSHYGGVVMYSTAPDRQPIEREDGIVILADTVEFVDINEIENTALQDLERKIVSAEDSESSTDKETDDIPSDTYIEEEVEKTAPDPYIEKEAEADKAVPDFRRLSISGTLPAMRHNINKDWALKERGASIVDKYPRDAGSKFSAMIHPSKENYFLANCNGPHPHTTIQLSENLYISEIRVDTFEAFAVSFSRIIVTGSLELNHGWRPIAILEMDMSRDTQVFHVAPICRDDEGKCWLKYIKFLFVAPPNPQYSLCHVTKLAVYGNSVVEHLDKQGKDEDISPTVRNSGTPGAGATNVANKRGIIRVNKGADHGAQYDAIKDLNRTLPEGAVGFCKVPAYSFSLTCSANEESEEYHSINDKKKNQKPEVQSQPALISLFNEVASLREYISEIQGMHRELEVNIPIVTHIDVSQEDIQARLHELEYYVSRRRFSRSLEDAYLNTSELIKTTCGLFSQLTQGLVLYFSTDASQSATVPISHHYQNVRGPVHAGNMESTDSTRDLNREIALFSYNSFWNVDRTVSILLNLKDITDLNINTKFAVLNVLMPSKRLCDWMGVLCLRNPYIAICSWLESIFILIFIQSRLVYFTLRSVEVISILGENHYMHAYIIILMLLFLTNYVRQNRLRVLLEEDIRKLSMEIGDLKAIFEEYEFLPQKDESSSAVTKLYALSDSFGAESFNDGVQDPISEMGGGVMDSPVNTVKNATIQGHGSRPWTR